MHLSRTFSQYSEKYESVFNREGQEKTFLIKNDNQTMFITDLINQNEMQNMFHVKALLS